MKKYFVLSVFIMLIGAFTNVQGQNSVTPDKGELVHGNVRLSNYERGCLITDNDMKHWTQYPVPLKVEDFKWAASKQAYAGHVAERNGKYYWFVSTNWCGIGVAVSDKITGPYKAALG